MAVNGVTGVSPAERAVLWLLGIVSAGFAVASVVFLFYGDFRRGLIWSCLERPGAPLDGSVLEPPSAPISLLPLGHVCEFRRVGTGEFLASVPPTDWTPTIQVAVPLVVLIYVTCRLISDALTLRASVKR